jgi:hypothetical protein
VQRDQEQLKESERLLADKEKSLKDLENNLSKKRHYQIKRIYL